jgi:competence protein ComEC
MVMFKKLFAICLALTLAFVTVHASGETVIYPDTVENPLLEVWFIAVGASDAFLLKSDNETMLVDGGHKTRFKWLNEFMIAQGITHVDSILNTHWDSDHITGVIKLLGTTDFTADVFYSPYKYDEKVGSYKPLKPLLEQKNIKYVTVDAGDEWMLGYARIQIFRDPNKKNGVNGQSLILKVTVGERTLLLAADIGPTAEKSVLKEYGTQLQAEILKFPHHGINICVTPFIDMVNPQIAIVTNQADSVPRTVSQLKYRKINAYYTCFRNVYLCTDGNEWRVSQEPPVKPE